MFYQVAPCVSAWAASGHFFEKPADGGEGHMGRGYPPAWTWKGVPPIPPGPGRGVTPTWPLSGHGKRVPSALSPTWTWEEGTLCPTPLPGPEKEISPAPPPTWTWEGDPPCPVPQLRGITICIMYLSCGCCCIAVAVVDPLLCCVPVTAVDPLLCL